MVSDIGDLGEALPGVKSPPEVGEEAGESRADSRNNRLDCVDDDDVDVDVEDDDVARLLPNTTLLWFLLFVSLLLLMMLLLL